MQTDPSRVSSTSERYAPVFVSALFDDMGRDYTCFANAGSFGCLCFWRRQLAAFLDIRHGMTCVDLMCGGGEAWGSLLPRLGADGQLVGVDFSGGMVERARARQTDRRLTDVSLRQEDALHTTLPDACADRVYCAYGVKTLDPAQLPALVAEVGRLLKPGGIAGFVEVASPPTRVLRHSYFCYLRSIVPQIGRILTGKMNQWGMLPDYVARFGDFTTLGALFQSEGFGVRHKRLFFGTASALPVTKP